MEMNILLYSALGVAVGFASGLVGTGGGVLLVPALVWILKDHRTAVGTTLAVMVPPIGLMAAVEYYRRGEVNLQAAAVIAATFIVGAWLGGKLAEHIHIEVLRLLFGLILIYVAVRFLLASDRDVASAFLGVIAVALAWLAYIGLRALGRRHLPRPSLGDQIRAMEQVDRTGEYHI
jgi:uncharacterized membrane protein YfcA